MKGLIFTTGTPDCEKLIRSFQAVVPDTVIVQYDIEGVAMINHATQIRPDIVVYIGAIGEFHLGHPVPTTDILCQINRIAPMVHLCSDAADFPWWPLLEEYHASQAFKLQVAIDGSCDNPIARFTERGKVALTPVDPNLFENPPWSSRPYICGFAGGGGARCDWIHPLKDKGILQWFNEAGYVPYDKFCTYYPSCQIVMNDARTGTGYHRHMKGRFVEASYAGAVLMEPRDSPARNWFVPGEDFLEWESTGEAEAHILAAPAKSDQNAAMGQRLRNKMIEKHSAPVFWGEVFREIGL